MDRVIVLFNLKDGVDAAEYEQWARETDLPIVNKLGSVDRFRIYRSTGQLIGDLPAPYQYIEVLDISDMAMFGADVAEEAMQAVAAEFQKFADEPCFITTQELT